ncbi:MAG: hypothetical protein EXS03_00930 [Phycisphaerales bacterium]|nr:hypothetical protein [Phycisphaerales bacterium]
MSLKSTDRRCLLGSVQAMIALGVFGLSMLAVPAHDAAAQYCAPALFLGDLNDDKKVNAMDVAVWNGLLAQGTYSACADINRNGILDNDDKIQLNRLVSFAGTTQGGLGANKGRIPAFTISEFRSAQPASALAQERYVEFRVPLELPPEYPFSRRFDAGYYLIMVARNNSTTLTNGIIKRVIDLSGAEFAAAGDGVGLALIVDSSFTLPIPPGVLPKLIPQPISFFQQNDLNTTWLLVYRRPSGTGYTAKAAFPAVNQAIDRNQNCEIDTRFTPVFGPPPPNALPPWDVVLDAVSAVRSPLTTGTGGLGCIYTHGMLFEVGPVDPGIGQLEAPFHVYRNSDNKYLSAFDQVVTTGVDTPGAPNASSKDGVYCGSPTAGICSEVHATPFCSDRDCCEYTCTLSPPCCTIVWDQICVDLASPSCGACGLPGTGGCFVAHGAPFCSALECCEAVCLQAPLCCAVQWDLACVTVARSACVNCGNAALPGCYQVGTTPSCDNAECCSLVCVVDPDCCSELWDQVCVDRAELFCQELECGSPSAQDCCLRHGTPFCRDAKCCQTVCSLDPVCCETVWDVQCVAEVLQFCVDLACPCGTGGASGGCFEVHVVPGCSSLSCCSSVCNSDPYCCGVTWDVSCVAAAESFCAQNPVCKGATGNCLVEHADPGCSDPACCDHVCAVDPACCTTGWDADCVAEVHELCEGCGDVFAGPCLQPHKSPACDDAVCCLIICATDPFCCEFTWDANCAMAALASCPPKSDVCAQAGGRSCFVASFLKGCDDPGCCGTICEIYDTYCCTVQWDAICVGEAMVFAQLQIGCELPTGAHGRGDCLVAHPETGCADLKCSTAVCSIQPDCCRIKWDATCAGLAPYVCIEVGGCPGDGSPFQVHPTPGSVDASCCNAVCYVEPECCSLAWDASCVSKANLYCRPDVEWNMPCTGSCVEAHENPGCEDIACGSAVCFSDANCCMVTWDQDCATLARGLCCGAPGCGNSCNEGCLTPHDSPSCSDRYCCAAVCAQDPYCCTVGWDFDCVKFAYQRCARGCGNDESGSCLSGHANAGCNNGICCVTICRLDSFCCETIWDSDCAAAAQAEALCQSALECGNALAGDCCSAHSENPACRSNACCEAVCKLDAICCDLAWDETCASEAVAIDECGCIKPCGDLCAGECCEAHATPNCRDLACCTLVCAQDTYCGESAWDVSCANLAKQLCTRGVDPACPPPECGDATAGDCCIPHLSPSCRVLVCCDSVCAMAAICCEISWDTQCAEIARTECRVCDGPGCGDPTTGSCFTPHPTPYCTQASCCALICGKMQPECCSIAWDESCVKLALFMCEQ